MKKRTNHWGDCTFYSSVINRRVYDGICTCGYGWEYRSDHEGDEKHLISKELGAVLHGIKLMKAKERAIWALLTGSATKPKKKRKNPPVYNATKSYDR